jgi:hypothetical protein
MPSDLTLTMDRSAYLFSELLRPKLSECFSIRMRREILTATLALISWHGLMIEFGFILRCYRSDVLNFETDLQIFVVFHNEIYI